MSYVYSDVNPFLTITSAGNIPILVDEEVVLQSVKTIISTVSGERVRNPIGTRLLRLLFQPMNDDLARQIRSELTTAILRHEPRVDIMSFNISPNYDGNYYDTNIIMRIKGIQGSRSIRTRLRSFSN